MLIVMTNILTVVVVTAFLYDTRLFSLSCVKYLLSAQIKILLLLLFLMGVCYKN